MTTDRKPSDSFNEVVNVQQTSPAEGILHEGSRGIVSIDNGQPVIFAPPAPPDSTPSPQAQGNSGPKDEAGKQ
jgi:hypothetical protein